MPEPGEGASTPKRAATLRDVARLAGVSVATVSKSLNGREHVRPETRERVVEAARALKFAPNPLAQSLLTGRTGTVGLLTSDMEGRFSLPVLMGAEDAFGTGNTSVFLCDARGDSVREQHHLRALLGRRVDGLIVVGDRTDARPSLGRSFPVPVVYAYAPSEDSDDVSVISDNLEAGHMAAEHVVSCGRRRVAYVGGDVTYSAARDRAAGAIEAMRAAGLELLGGEPLFGAWTEEWGRGATRILATRFPDLDALLCGSDQIARGALDALRDMGRSVPDEVAVMGHDNWEPIAAQARPPLTTLDMQLELLGKRAAELLFDAMDGTVRPGVHRVRTRLVTRGSTALA